MSEKNRKMQRPKPKDNNMCEHIGGFHTKIKQWYI